MAPDGDPAVSGLPRSRLHVQCWHSGPQCQAAEHRAGPAVEQAGVLTDVTPSISEHELCHLTPGTNSVLPKNRLLIPSALKAWGLLVLGC